jgi:hypothetical protein
MSKYQENTRQEFYDLVWATPMAHWQSGHLLGRWHDRKARSLESYLNGILVAMLTGAAIVRHNRIAAEIAKRQREEAHEAYSPNKRSRSVNKRSHRRIKSNSAPSR